MSDSKYNNRSYEQKSSEKSIIKNECEAPSLIQNFSYSSKKKYPSFPIKNIYLPELFINNNDFIERYICGLCEKICENPRYQYCGCEQIYCKKCLDFYYETFHHMCPKCQKETNELIPSESVNESILKLNMKCCNYVDGCKWVGQLKDYNEHITKNCPKEIINCPNKGCIIKTKREEMPKHLPKCEYREIICDKCKIKMPVKDKNLHKKFCTKEKIQCPRKCGAVIERENIANHFNECPFTYIDCPYKFLGCNDTFINKEKDERLKKDTSKHLNLAIEKIKYLEKELNEIKKITSKINNFDKDRIDLKREINELKEIIKNNKNNGVYQNNQNNILIKEENDIIIKNNKNENEIENDIQNNQEPINNINSCLLSKKRKFSVYKSEEKSYKEFSIFANNNNNEEEEQKKININNNNNINSLDYITNNDEKEPIYDLLENTKHLFAIRDNIIESTNLEGEKHYYVFFNDKYDIPKTGTKKYIFTVKFLEKCEWLAVGVCDKKMVEKNNFECDMGKKNVKKRNQGTYTINANRVVWNCNNMKQCIKLNYNSLNKKDTIIQCTLSPIACELEFMLNNEFFIILNDVRCFISDSFSPCLIFLKNTSIETTFNYD